MTNPVDLVEDQITTFEGVDSLDLPAGIREAQSLFLHFDVDGLLHPGFQLLRVLIVDVHFLKVLITFHVHPLLVGQYSFLLATLLSFDFLGFEHSSDLSFQEIRHRWHQEISYSLGNGKVAVGLRVPEPDDVTGLDVHLGLIVVFIGHEEFGLEHGSFLACIEQKCFRVVVLIIRLFEYV